MVRNLLSSHIIWDQNATGQWCFILKKSKQEGENVINVIFYTKKCAASLLSCFSVIGETRMAETCVWGSYFEGKLNWPIFTSLDNKRSTDVIFICLAHTWSWLTPCRHVMPPSAWSSKCRATQEADISGFTVVEHKIKFLILWIYLIGRVINDKWMNECLSTKSPAQLSIPN